MAKDTNDKILQERQELQKEKDEFLKIKQEIISKPLLFIYILILIEEKDNVISKINEAKQRQVEEEQRLKQIQLEETRLAEERKKASMHVPEPSKPLISSVCSYSIFYAKTFVCIVKKFIRKEKRWLLR